MAVLNPNNWHWVDKNTLPWTKQYLNEKFVNYGITENNTTIKIIQINRINGDSNVSQRKGKPICYFDLELEFKLNVTNPQKNEENENENEEEESGTLHIPEFMHDDTEPLININGFNQFNSTLIQTSFIPAFKTLLLQYQNDLLEEHSNDLQE